MPIRSTICACAAVAVAVGCGGSQKTVHKAQTSGYDTDFAVVFSEALAAVQELYPHLDENPSAGWIKTSWHQLKINQSNTTHEAQGVGLGEARNQGGGVIQDPNNPSSSTAGAFGGTRTTGKLHFVRFRVYVLGGRPWRVRVEAEAAEYEPGLKPAPLKGADIPPWLRPRAEALQVKIYKRLQKYAVPIDPNRGRTRVAKKKAPPKLGKYGEIPKPAAQRVHALRTALLAGDFDQVRAFLVEEFVWSAGATPSADQALMMWKADPTLPSRLVAALDAGCAAADAAAIACPADAVTGQLQATFANVAGEWKLTSFVSAE